MFDNDDCCFEKKCCVHFPCSNLPTTLRELLEVLIFEKVTLSMRSGEIEHDLTIKAISGDLLIAKHDCRFKFIVIDCICDVLVDRDTIEGLIEKGKLCRNDGRFIPGRTTGRL